MSKLRLDTKDEIISFFKILAEESVKDARTAVYDPAATRLEKSVAADKLVYKLDEQPEEEREEEIEDVETSDAPPTPPPLGGDDDIEIEDEESVEIVDKQVYPSLEGLTDLIKLLRSGISVDDTSVQIPLRTYFDLLTDSEKTALYAFFDAVASIMTQTADGETAPDPSEPPYNIQMTGGGEEEEVFSSEEDIEIEPAGGDEISFSAEEEEEEEEDEENVPITPGRPPEEEIIAEMRRKVRSLLSRS
jgi:hypothetical protein